MRLFLLSLFLLSGTPSLAQEAGPDPAIVEANPAPEREEDERWKVWRKAAIAAHVADLATTQICIRRDTCLEGNPIIGRSPSTAKLIGFKAASAALNWALITEVAKRDPKVARIFGIVSVGVFGGAAMLNARFAFK